MDSKAGVDAVKTSLLKTRGGRGAGSLETGPRIFSSVTTIGAGGEGFFGFRRFAVKISPAAAAAPAARTAGVLFRELEGAATDWDAKGAVRKKR